MQMYQKQETFPQREKVTHLIILYEESTPKWWIGQHQAPILLYNFIHQIQWYIRGCHARGYLAQRLRAQATRGFLSIA